jgi:hypothetical protein
MVADSKQEDLSDEERSALLSLRKLFPGHRIVLIGATALRPQTRSMRPTHDLDLTVASRRSSAASVCRRAANSR